MAEAEITEEVGKSGGRMIWLGVLTMIVGIVAISSPFITGIALKIVVGWALVIGGIFQIIHCFRADGGWKARVFFALSGLLALVCGGYILARPLQALLAFTLLLAAYFLADGITKIFGAFRMKPDSGWGWLLFSGVITLLLGIMIWRQWPVSGAWAIGLLFGINLVFNGWTMIFLGSGVKALAKEAEA